MVVSPSYLFHEKISSLIYPPGVSAVTPDNFLFVSVEQGDQVRQVLAKAPADKPVKIQGSDGVSYPTVKSQPIPNHYTWESKADDIAYTIFTLANFTHGNARLFD